MLTGAVITEGLTTTILALTPVERWQAARELNTNFMAEHWLVLTAGATLIVLTGLLFWVSRRRAAEERRIADELFAEYAGQRGLSPHECQILLEVVNKSRLKRHDAIFTMQDAFDRGADALIEKSIATQTAEASEQLRIELSFLREKLGFRSPGSIELPAKLRRASSQQIPVGRKLLITRRKARDSVNMECTVARNDEAALTVELTTPSRSKPGDVWRVRYYFGASVWEFDTSVASCKGKTLVLNHSDNVRFINRRRFFRVPVNKPAFIARFPFAITLPADSRSRKKGSKAKKSLTKASGTSWGPPEFVPAVVTELAGPGLRIERIDVPLELKVADRVLVVFTLNGEEDSGSGKPKTGKVKPSRVVEDIGVVRHTRATDDGWSIAVELVGLNDTDINELIRATNAASSRTVSKSQDNQGSGIAEQRPEAKVAEPVAAQEV